MAALRFPIRNPFGRVSSERERFNATATELQVLVRMFGSKLMVFRETMKTDIAGVVVAGDVADSHKP